MDASNVPEAPAPKSLSERVAYAKSSRSHSHSPLTNASANPKAQPKSATKGNANGSTKGAARAASRTEKPKKGRNTNRPKPKTAEELDAEMTDYFGGNINSNGGSAAAAVADGMATGVSEPAANGEDLGMDEISVRSDESVTWEIEG